VDTQTQQVLDAALALPERERILIAERLLESVPNDIDELSEEEFAAELNRRSEEVIQGKAELIPWAVVKEQMRAKTRRRYRNSRQRSGGQ
jgi:putative addiction module component (TIGR02574 family)